MGISLFKFTFINLNQTLGEGRETLKKVSLKKNHIKAYTASSLLVVLQCLVLERKKERKKKKEEFIQTLFQAHRSARALHCIISKMLKVHVYYRYLQVIE